MAEHKKTLKRSGRPNLFEAKPFSKSERKKTKPKINFNILESGDIRITTTSTSGPASKQIGMATKSDVNTLFSDGKITEEQKNKALEAIKSRPKARMKKIAPKTGDGVTPRMRYMKMDKGGDTKKPKKKKEGIAIMIAVGKIKKGKDKMSYGGMAGGKKHMYAAGGSVSDNLKPIPPSNKGLPNLPKEVRNKMGYMRKGGFV